MRFLEWNTELPAISAALVQSAAEIQFQEWNTLLPGQTGRAVKSFADVTFLEWNTTLPGAAARIQERRGIANLPVSSAFVECPAIVLGTG